MTTKSRNADPGVTLVGQDIYEESATQKYKLGERFEVGPRVFYYGKASGTCAAGKIARKVVSTANHHDLTTATHAIGSEYLTVTLGGTAVTKDEYKGGFIGIIAGTGLGQVYEILKHDAQSSTSGDVDIYLEQSLITATANSDSKTDLMRNPWDGIIPSATEALVGMGVPLIAVTTNCFAWFQTQGPAVVLAGDIAAENTLLMAGNTAGEFLTQAAYTKGLEAIVVGQAHANTEYNFVILNTIWR